MTPRTEVGRLAFRVEGNFWNAYWAPHQDRMDGALLLGSVRFNAVERSQALKNEFMELMKRVFADAAKDAFGQPVGWTDPVRAPEHERSGRS